MKATIAIWVLSGALLASASLNVYHAGRSALPGEPCPGWTATTAAESRPVCRMVDALGLSEGQQQKISRCCEGVCGSQHQQRGQQMRVLMAELQRQLNAEPLDRERIAQLVDEIATLRVQGWKDRIQGIVQVRETLTGEQLERLMAAVQGP